MPGVTRMTAPELPPPRCQTPPASTNAASRSRELNTGDGHPQLDVADRERVAAGGRDRHRVGIDVARP